MILVMALMLTCSLSPPIPPSLLPFSHRLLQLHGDLDDLEAALGANPADIGSRKKSRVVGSGSCSALVKLLPDYKELFVGHDTWTDYNTMLRIFKRYDLRYDVGGGSPGELRI